MPKLSNVRITEHTVRSAKPQTNRYFIRDANLRGFLLRVNPNGSKTFYVQLDTSAKRKIGDASILTVTSARNQAKDLLIRHSRGELLKSSQDHKPTLGKFLDTTFRPFAITHNRHGVTEVKRLVSALGNMVNIRIDKLSQIRIERWKKDRLKKVKPSTVNRELASLKSVLNRAVEWGVITASPAKNVRRLKDVGDKRVRYLSDAERARLLLAMSEGKHHHIQYIVGLILNTGMRRGEVFGLMWENIKFGDNPTLTVRSATAKSIKERHVPLNRTAVSLLRKWQLQSVNREGNVFPNAHGNQLTDVKNSWGTLIKAAKVVDFRFHDLRHDFASSLVMKGIDLYSVKELLGHSTIEMTQRYAHLSPGRLQQDVSVLETV